MKTNLICLVPSLLVSLLGGASEAPPNDSLQNLIENVRANEHLYDRVEMKTERRYLASSGAPTIRGSVRKSQESKRYVQQDRMIFQDWKDEGESVEVGNFSNTSKMGYDGRSRRVLQGKIANITEGPYDQIESPHIMALPRGLSVRFPLSIYLTGGDTLHSYSKFNRWDTRATYLGEEPVDGLRCSKVLMESRDRNPPQALMNKIYLWLAHDRNELPIRVVGYAPSYSDKLPIEEARVTKLKEVAPGVWFPMAIHFTIYQEMRLREGKSVVSNTADVVTSFVDLNPNYPVEFFQNIDIPKGDSVYELKNDTIVKSYIQGGEPSKPKSSGIGSIVVVIAVVCVTILLLLAALWFRSKAKRASPF